MTDMFPDYLDNAKVLFYTERKQYGKILFTDGSLDSIVFYYAICKYRNEDAYYLFGCDSNKVVVSDLDCESIEECKTVAEQLSDELPIMWIKKE